MSRKFQLFAEGILFIGLAVLLSYGAEQYMSGAEQIEKEYAPLKTAKITSSPQSNFLTVYKPDKVSAGFTLYPVEGGAKVYLLNMQGQRVHEWNTDAERARLLPNGNLLVIHGSKWGRTKKVWRRQRDRIREYDWHGNIVWQYQASDLIHHDAWRLENGNTLMLRRTIVPASHRAKILDSTRRSFDIRSDSILEVTPSGNIAWEWHAHEQLDLNSCGKRGCHYLKGNSDASDSAKDWTHMNTAMPLPENRWYDAGDERFKPGNILFLPRNWWTAFIADRESKRVVWKYEGDYRGGLGGGHEANMIPKGLPGEGNILIFDNGSGVHKGESIALEINPTDNTLVWKYEAPEFHSRTRGSLQRLPNGNTLISEDVSGRVFEVTADKEIVWQYEGPSPSNRARRYSYDYSPAFKRLNK